MKFYLAQSCLGSSNVCNVVQKTALTSLVTRRLLGWLIQATESESRRAMFSGPGDGSPEISAMSQVSAAIGSQG